MIHVTLEELRQLMNRYEANYEKTGEKFYRDMYQFFARQYSQKFQEMMENDNAK